MKHAKEASRVGLEMLVLLCNSGIFLVVNGAEFWDDQTRSLSQLSTKSPSPGTNRAPTSSAQPTIAPTKFRQHQHKSNLQTISYSQKGSHGTSLQRTHQNFYPESNYDPNAGTHQKSHTRSYGGSRSGSYKSSHRSTNQPAKAPTATPNNLPTKGPAKVPTRAPTIGSTIAPEKETASMPVKDRRYVAASINAILTASVLIPVSTQIDRVFNSQVFLVGAS